MAKTTTHKENSTKRQPVVAVMGHVDHGKTTFLDTVRGTRIAAKEHGGITQNTRAHEVVTPSGFKITFIDTPGHAAFRNMRKRGARVTDFVLLIVAADDGLQPQTKESIKFAKENNVPIIVAVNKIDLPGVNTQRIKQELASFEVQIEEYGGDALYFEISAKNNINIDKVLEGIELLTEISDLKPRELKEGVIAEGFVMESSLDKHIGHSALCILKAGTLSEKVFGVTKAGVFKVRAYLNEDFKQESIIHESQPFTVTGLKEDISTGEIINFVETEAIAKALQIKLATGEVSEDAVEEKPKLAGEALFAQLLMQQEEKKKGVQQKELNIILRASSQGTLEAVKEKLDELETEESKVRILTSGTGQVSEDDINFAKTTKAILISFQTDVPKKILDIARKNKVLIREYKIIYNLVDELAEVLDSMDEPQEQEIEMGKAKVLQVFTLSDGSQVAGCRVLDGKFARHYTVWAQRGEPGSELDEVGRSKVTSVRQLKNEVKEAKKGTECGLLLNPAIEGLEIGDEIVAYRVERY